MMSALIQLKKAYEDEGMTIEQIAEDQELDIVSIKAGLMQVSSKYRKACGIEDEEEDRDNFTRDQLRDANKVIYELMQGAEDEHLRGKMAIYIRDDKKGRKEVVKAMANQTFNILQFNEGLQKVRELKRAMIKKVA